MNIRRGDLREILTPGPTVVALHAQREQEITYAEETGYHIYGELRLGLRITAADDLRSARQYLAVLEHYALAAEVAAAAVAPAVGKCTTRHSESVPPQGMIPFSAIERWEGKEHARDGSGTRRQA